MGRQTQDYDIPDAPGADSEKSDTLAGTVSAALAAHGYSVRAWARAHGWANQSVDVVIKRWIEVPGRRGRMPLGGVSRAIIVALQKELGADIVPLQEQQDRPVMRRAS